MAVSRAYTLEQQRTARLRKRLKDGDYDVMEWNKDRFERPRD